MLLSILGRCTQQRAVCTGQGARLCKMHISAQAPEPYIKGEIIRRKMNNGVRKYDPSTDLRAFFEENGIKVVKIGSPDIDGLMRGKRVMAEYFIQAVASSGSNLCNILFGWDIH